ncbi:MAG: efflux RND transporter permease subunit [Phycisphaerales bacterium JB039]
MSDQSHVRAGGLGGAINRIVSIFLDSNLSIVLIIVAAAVGVGALLVTPREEDPQIVVPMADVIVEFPGHPATQVEQLVTNPLERLLYQIDGVEYVYSRSMRDRSIVTVRFFVGQDRERSLVKIRKKIDENLDIVPPGAILPVIKPREIDDVPVVTLTLASRSGDGYTARRVAEELVERLAVQRDVSRTEIIGGSPRVLAVELDRDRLAGFNLAPLDIGRAIGVSSLTRSAGAFVRDDQVIEVETGRAIRSADDLATLVVGAFEGRPVFLEDVATIRDGPDELTSFVRHGWGPARDEVEAPDAAGAALGPAEHDRPPAPAVTIAIAKKRGTNAVNVADEVIAEARRLAADIVPDDIELIITRNYGRNANEKVNELIDALGVAIVIVIALLTLGLGWREAVIVAVAVPVVFGLTLVVNLLAGYSINRVTLFALILSLGLIVDDPIVDVENISRLFRLRGRATRQIVLEAVAEIRPPLIVATLAVIASFVPLSFITGLMGPYMAPMALNVPVAMLMSMLVAFTITPWLSYHLLRGPIERARKRGTLKTHDDVDDIDASRGTLLDRILRPLITPLVTARWRAWLFLGVIALLTAGTASLALFRQVPLKLLPYDNRNELLLVLDADEGVPLERTDAVVRALEAKLATVPEVTDYTAYIGLPSPIDFNGLVRQYYFRAGEHVAEIRVNLAPKHSRSQQSHAIALRLHDELTSIAEAGGAKLKVVEIPPGPPVLATVVVEAYAAEDRSLDDLISAAGIVRQRLALEPGVIEVDTSVAADSPRATFIVDQEKAAINGVSVDDIAETVAIALGGRSAGLARIETERYPLHIRVRMPEAERSDLAALQRLRVTSHDGALVPLAELGDWTMGDADQPILHKNLRRVVYVTAETAGRPPPDVILDIITDREPHEPASAGAIGAVEPAAPRPVAGRSFLDTLRGQGGGIGWSLNPDFELRFAGEGEWKITLDVFRDLGLAFGAALVAIYILLVAQTGSFALPLIIMLAIPLTVIGIMPGFWLLNVFAGDGAATGGYANPTLFTATAMIGMIALSGIVTRQATILVDFIHLAQRRGKPLQEAIVASCVVRLRPILLTASTAMLSAAPIIIDPIFSGLAWALIFGLGAATIFAVAVIPVAYWLLAPKRVQSRNAEPAEQAE